MKKNWRILGGVMMFAVAALVTACNSNGDSPGLEYMPDMYRSPAIEPYVDYGEIRGREQWDVKMTQSALTPPDGTLPYYGTDEELVELMMPWSIKPHISFKQSHGLVGFDFNMDSTTNYETEALAWTHNPVPLMGENGKETLDLGKKLYTSKCQHCHGEKGDGNGPMMQSGAFNGVPDYATKKELSNGQIFYSIYYGKGAMGSHASILNKKEIWTLVHYVRQFQDEDYGKTPVETAAEGEENENEENAEVVEANEAAPAH